MYVWGGGRGGGGGVEGQEEGKYLKRHANQNHDPLANRDNNVMETTVVCCTQHQVNSDVSNMTRTTNSHYLILAGITCFSRKTTNLQHMGVT